MAHVPYVKIVKIFYLFTELLEIKFDYFAFKFHISAFYIFALRS